MCSQIRITKRKWPGFRIELFPVRLDGGANWNWSERHVPSNVCIDPALSTCDGGLPNVEPDRADDARQATRSLLLLDYSALILRVLQRNERSSIEIVLNSLHDAGNTLPRWTLEVDDPVHALFPAALVANSGAPRCPGSRRSPRESDRQTRMRVAFVQLGLVRKRVVPIGERGRLALDDAGTVDVAEEVHCIMKTVQPSR
ncbi:hypothetical protein FGB62_86g017 [Gracilaria domingensis]|nr:hypothetical protein FGB62_86g017 [Gracilaria domingensis]